MKKSEYLKICKKCKGLCCKLGGTNLTKKEVDKILNAGYKNHFKRVEKDIYELKCDSDGICPYLQKDYSCKIQAVKPLICTCWPIFPEYDCGKIEHVLINCPLVKKMSKSDIEKSRKQSESVQLDVAKYTADETMTSKKLMKLIKKRYEMIERGK